MISIHEELDVRIAIKYIMPDKCPPDCPHIAKAQ